jgi:hypothetical protein
MGCAGEPWGDLSRRRRSLIIAMLLYDGRCRPQILLSEMLSQVPDSPIAAVLNRSGHIPAQQAMEDGQLVT